jgi:uncharacterized lipoprotein
LRTLTATALRKGADIENCVSADIREAYDTASGVERSHRAGQQVRPVGDADLATGALLVCFGPGDAHHQTLVDLLEILGLQGDDLTAAKGAGEACEQ